MLSRCLYGDTLVRYSVPMKVIFNTKWCLCIINIWEDYLNIRLSFNILKRLARHLLHKHCLNRKTNIHSWCTSNFSWSSMYSKYMFNVNRKHFNSFAQNYMFTFLQYMRSPPVFSAVRDVQSLVFCVVFYRGLFVLLSFFFWPLCCLSFFD